MLALMRGQKTANAGTISRYLIWLVVLLFLILSLFAEKTHLRKEAADSCSLNAGHKQAFCSFSDIKTGF